MLWTDEQRAVSPALDTGGRDLPTTFGETFSAAWSRNTLFSQDYFGENDRMSALTDYLAKVKTMTGEDIGQQLDYRMPEGAAVSAQDLLRQANEKVSALKQKNPALELEPMTPDELSANGVAKRRKADADFEETIDRPRGPGATVGRWLGGGAAGVADPINLAALPIAPEAELGILASAVRWGAIAGGAGAVSTTLAAPYREQVQPGYVAGGGPLAEIAEQAAFGAAGGAAFPIARAIAQPVVSRLAAAWDRVRGPNWPTSVKDAGNIVSSQANINQSNIYPGAAGAAAHEQALAKTTNDVLAGRPVDVSQHITPEHEARAAEAQAPIDASRARAQAAAVAAERPVPVEPAPELPFERTAAEANAEARKQDLILDLYDAAREHGYDDIPMEEAGRIADKMMAATPEQAAKLFRDFQMSPRQVADAPTHIEPPAEPLPVLVPRIEDIHAPDYQAAVRADIDRELARVPPHPEPRTLAEIDNGAVPTHLPEQHELYFNLDQHTRMVPIEDLISSKTPEENAKGAVNGAKRMAASAAGEIGRRAPITVRPLPNGKYLVLDGNGTLTAAQNYGWRHMPVKPEQGQISEMGMPASAASLAEAGRVAPGTSSSGLIAPEGAAVQPTPLAQISGRTEPLGSLIKRTISPPDTTTGPSTFSDFKLGIDPTSNRKIFQGTEDYKAVRNRMELNKPLVDEELQRIVDEVAGTEYHGSRVKNLEGSTGLEVKVQTLAGRGRSANSISDILGARVIAETPQALDEFAQRIHDTGAVLEDENFLHTSKDGYRARHMQIALDDGTSIELQIVPRPIAEVQEVAHEIRQPVKRLDFSDPEYIKTITKVRDIFDGAWGKAAQWVAGRPPERIAGVAIRDRDTGKVYSKPNVMHVDMYEAAAKDLGIRYEDAWNAKTASGSRPRFDEGFTTNIGRYVGRKQAAAIAQRMDQTYAPGGGGTLTPEQRARVGLDAGDLRPIESPLPHGIATFSPYELGVDPERFQFKAGGDEAGVTDRLKDVKTWDPIKSGMSLVWVDRAGKPWIVDGHQRLGLARRIAGEDPAQNPQIFARTLREDEGYTPEKARTLAALKNIAEGTGTAVDAAKVIRDHPELAGDLPPRSELVKQARGLVNLDRDAFQMVVNDVVPSNYAAIVGRLVPSDGAMQGALLRLLAKTDPANAIQAEAIARQGIEAGMAKAEAGKQASLFGDQEVTESLYLERAKVLDRALKTLRRDKTVFGTLVKEAETLEGAGNVLAKDINEQRAIADGQALQIIQTLANRAGPISDALRTAAGRAKSDGNYRGAVGDFVQTVRDLSASGDLARLANGLERGPSHVGSENTTGIIDHGLAAEPSEPAAIDAAELEVKDAFAQGKARPTFEPGAEGKPQAVMPGMEPSARQLAAARAGPLRAGVPQEEPGELFSAPHEAIPDMFLFNGQPQSFAEAVREVDGLKIAADQLAACAAPEQAEAA
jgi:hypothetical protein